MYGLCTKSVCAKKMFAQKKCLREKKVFAPKKSVSAKLNEHRLREKQVCAQKSYSRTYDPLGT